MSAVSYLNLDWRADVSNSRKIQILQQFLTDADERGVAGVRPARVRGDLAALVEEPGQDPVVLRKEDTISVRRTTTFAYWDGIMSMVDTLIDIMAHQTPIQARYLQYKQTRLLGSLEQAQKAWHEVALSTGLHPWALGVTPASTGEYSLPPRLSLKCVCITNILKYNVQGLRKKDSERAITTEHGQVCEIPVLLKELKTRGAAPAAVVVVEHRNLKTLMEGAHPVKGVLLVMTSGYPSAATKEFLHMLSLDENLRKTPFLYFSDHDIHGLQIFQVLKYGSKQNAESNRIMICPRLQWAGPSKEDLLTSPTTFYASHEAQHKLDNPRAGPAAVERAMVEWKEKMDRQIPKKLIEASDKDHALAKGLNSLGWLKYETSLADELGEMLNGKSMFRLADLAHVGNGFIHLFVQQKVETLSTAAVRTKQLVPQQLRSPTGAKWRDIATQSQSLSRQIEDVDEAELLALEIQ